MKPPAAIIACAALALGIASAPDAGDFERFCAEWMRKLERREAHNLRQMKMKSSAGWTVGEYTGYGRDPLSCKTRERVQPGKRTVGMLVYREFRYRKQGIDPVRARISEPWVVETVEVMEIFPFDGSRWSY